MKKTVCMACVGNKIIAERSDDFVAKPTLSRGVTCNCALLDRLLFCDFNRREAAGVIYGGNNNPPAFINVSPLSSSHHLMFMFVIGRPRRRNAFHAHHCDSMLEWESEIPDGRHYLMEFGVNEADLPVFYGPGQPLNDIIGPLSKISAGAVLP